MPAGPDSWPYKHNVLGSSLQLFVCFHAWPLAASPCNQRVMISEHNDKLRITSKTKQIIASRL